MWQQQLFDLPLFPPEFADAKRLCAAFRAVNDEAKREKILISPRVLMKVKNAVKVEPVGEFELKRDQATAGGV
jgi:hypothetical protein